MKIAFRIIVLAVILEFIAGCAERGETAHLSSSYGREGDFNSNNSMPSAW